MSEPDEASNPLAPGDFANPLPPPSKPKGSGRPPPATPMSNNDFRKLLATPRAGDGAQATPRGGGGQRNPGGGEFQKPKPKPKAKPRPKAAEEPEGPSYRDRAKERRDEANPDYTGDQGDGALTGIPGVPGVTNQEELRQLSIEESKFLGGDVEHTHLVKGLDFALLRKVRSELEESVKDEEYQRGAGAGAGASGKVGVPVSAGAAGQVLADGKVASFRSTMARSVYDLAVKARVRDGGGGGDVKPNERFASGRVSFTFDVGVAGGGVNRDAAPVSDIPTTTMRSRSDVDTAKGGSAANMMMAGRDAAVLERLSQIMVYLRLGGKSGKKMQRRKEGRAEAEAAVAAAAGGVTSGGLAGKPGLGGSAGVGRAQQHQAPTRAAAPKDEEDDEDIFGDVGRDYEPTVVKKKEAAESGKSVSYFGDGHTKGEASVVLPRSTTNVGSAGAYADTNDAAAGADGSRGRGGVVSVDANGLAGPMPEPPAPDFKSIDPFKTHYREYVAAGTVSSPDGKTGHWDPNAAGSYLQTCPDFALAITAHSVTVLEAEEAAEEEAGTAKASNGGGGKGDKSRQRVKPLDAAAAKAELERRAEASLATDDGYAECYAGFDGYVDAVYQSDDDDDGDGSKRKTRGNGEEDEGGLGGEGDADGAKVGGKGGKAGLGAVGKGGKMSVKAMEAQRDQKLNSELGNLHKMMKEKYGDKVDAAFGGRGGGGGGGDNEGEGSKSVKGGSREEKRGGFGGGSDGGGDDSGDGGAGSRRGKRLKI